jgi:hypothetical protein
VKTLAALTAVVALVLAPQALPAGYVIVTEHSPSQNAVDRANAAPKGYQIVTEHSPSQNRIDRINAAPAGYQIVTEHSPSQNRVDRINAAPAGYQIVTEHSPSQNRIDRLNAAPLATSSGSAFRWSDAGIGASAAFGVVLILSGTALVLLRRRGRLAF